MDAGWTALFVFSSVRLRLELSFRFVDTEAIFTQAPEWERSIVVSVFVCTSVCLSASMCQETVNAFTYPERLKLLGLERLEDRRIRADILFAYKLLFGHNALHADDFFILSATTGTRGHPYKLSFPRCSTDVRRHFFCHRVIKILNELPVDTDFSSINSFARELVGLNFSDYCDNYY